VFIRFYQMLAARRRRRALIKIRREFARWGYPLDGTADADIEAALPPGTCENPPDHLGAKTISRALRRLSIGTRWQVEGEAAEPVVRPEYGPRDGGLRALPHVLTATRSGIRSTGTHTGSVRSG
jgi:hypothetical protein